MDFNKLLKELYTYDQMNIYNIVNIQCVFYCFIQYSEKRILEDDEDIKERLLESILELYEKFLPRELKRKIPELVEKLDDLLEPFILQLAKTLDTSLLWNDDELQTSIAKFLDEGVYSFFEETIPEIHLCFTKTNELLVEKTLEIFDSEIISDEILDIEEKEEPHKKLYYAFQFRKKTLRKKNITPMKSRRFINRSIRNKKSL